MVPMFIILAPLYTLMSKLGLINTRVADDLLFGDEHPYCTVTLRVLPAHSRLAGGGAQIDGCGRIQEPDPIVIPVMASGVAATFMFVLCSAGTRSFSRYVHRRGAYRRFRWRSTRSS
jgi:multiple sugar transport system permease protein